MRGEASFVRDRASDGYARHPAAGNRIDEKGRRKGEEERGGERRGEGERQRQSKNLGTKGDRQNQYYHNQSQRVVAVTQHRKGPHSPPCRQHAG